MAKPKGLKHTNIQFTIYQQYINKLPPIVICYNARVQMLVSNMTFCVYMSVKIFFFQKPFISTPFSPLRLSSFVWIVSLSYIEKRVID